MSTIKGVILDIDGVLLDSVIIWVDLGERYLNSLGIEAEPGLAETLFSMSMEQAAEYIRDHYPIGRDAVQIIDDLSDMIRDFYYYEVQAKPGARELLEQFSAPGVKITAASSSFRDHIEHALERNGLLGYVSRIFTCSEERTSKRSPDIYYKAAAFMGTAPDETLVFEDSLYALSTAAAAGFHTVGVYDANGESDKKGLEAAAERYILSLADFGL